MNPAQKQPDATAEDPAVTAAFAELERADALGNQTGRYRVTRTQLLIVFAALAAMPFLIGYIMR